MKIIFEATKGRLKEIKKYEEAIHIIEEESQQGFFKARFDSEFKKFSEKSPLEDARKVDLYILKVYGKGVYKLTGNLGYNGSTKQIKFYTTSVFENSKFDFDDKNLVEVFNDGLGNFREHMAELEVIVSKLKSSKPKGNPNFRSNNNKGPAKKKKVDPRRTGLSDAQKERKSKKQDSKNYRTDSRRKVSNNKKSSFK